MPEPHLRAADADRAAVAGVLGQHMAAGRLTVDEYDERLTRAYAARTFGELSELTADLPPHLPAPTRASAPGTSAVGKARRRSGTWDRYAWQAWLRTSLIVVTIWFIASLASGLHFFWPIWVIGPWGAVLLVQALAGGYGEAGGYSDDDDGHRQLGT